VTFEYALISGSIPELRSTSRKGTLLLVQPGASSGAGPLRSMRKRVEIKNFCQKGEKHL